MTVASLVVAIVAAGAALWALRYARSQKLAAERSADASERSATAAEASARAALTSEERALRAEQDAAAMQARLVTSTMVYPTWEDERNGWDWHYGKVTNDSDMPIHVPRLEDMDYQVSWVKRWHGGWRVVADLTEDYSEPDVLRPHESHSFPADPEIDEAARPAGAQYGPPIPLISFTDARGIRWRRRGADEPEREP